MNILAAMAELSVLRDYMRKDWQRAADLFGFDADRLATIVREQTKVGLDAGRHDGVMLCSEGESLSHHPVYELQSEAAP